MEYVVYAFIKYEIFRAVKVIYQQRELCSTKTQDSEQSRDKYIISRFLRFIFSFMITLLFFLILAAFGVHIIGLAVALCQFYWPIECTI